MTKRTPKYTHDNGEPDCSGQELITLSDDDREWLEQYLNSPEITSVPINAIRKLAIAAGFYTESGTSA